MKQKFFILIFLSLLTIIIAGCTTTEQTVSEPEVPAETQIIEEEIEPEVSVEQIQEEIVEEEPVIEEPVVEEIPEEEIPEEEITEEVYDELEEEPVVEEINDEDEEYERSINNMEGSVTKEDFVEDKKDILARIKKLDDVMTDGDFFTWKTLVEPSSLSYWSLKGNLKKVSSMLPIKGIQLNNLEDYFKFVFIQSRIGRQIDEIRYISDSYVKAVQVTDSQDVVYYYFVKISGVWKLSLPPLND